VVQLIKLLKRTLQKTTQKTKPFIRIPVGYSWNDPEYHRYHQLLYATELDDQKSRVWHFDTRVEWNPEQNEFYGAKSACNKPTILSSFLHKCEELDLPGSYIPNSDDDIAKDVRDWFLTVHFPYIADRHGHKVVAQAAQDKAVLQDLQTLWDKRVKKYKKAEDYQKASFTLEEETLALAIEQIKEERKKKRKKKKEDDAEDQDDNDEEDEEQEEDEEDN
jgi:hypothetical protein